MSGIDFAALMEPVARQLCGEPNHRLSSKETLCFGTHGSLAVEIRGERAGTFYDFERNVGGGVLDFVAHKIGAKNGEAKAWLTEQGYTLHSDTKAGSARIEATYDYFGADGELVFQVVRKHPKKFLQRRSDGTGGWIWNLKGVTPVLYRLPELLEADPARVVFVPEGEKDVDRLRSLGFVATCNSGGAGKWRATHSAALRGRRVVVLPDNDDAGHKHAAEVSASLQRVAASVAVLPLPDLPSKGDVSDWLDAGGTAPDLGRLVAEALETPADAGDEEKPGPAPRDAAGFELNEDGVALGFAAAAQGRFVFDHTSQQWFRWDGGRWALDAKAGAFHQVRLFVRKVRERQPEPPKAMAKIAFTSNVERAARTDPRLAVSHEDWDRDRWLLGVPGGVIDLRTGEHGPGDPKHFIRRQTAVAPAAPSTPTPLWSAFLKDATRDDADLQGFLQRLAGYVLTGDVSEEVLTFLYGPGGNGKGVFLGVVVAILADYAVQVPVEVFVANSRLNLEYYRARMVGARLVTASETEAGATWSESLIKELTGNEAPLSARDPYGKPFTFLPHFKLCLVGNHAPRLKGRTPAMERRLRVVPFTHEPAKPDLELKEKLRGEYPAILRWMLDGCREWRAKRLGTSKAIGEATSAYFQQQDGFRRWMAERCDLGGTVSEKPGRLFSDFAAWARDSGEASVSAGEFREMVERTKGLQYKTNKGTQWVRGIALKPVRKAEDGPLSNDDDEECVA